MHFFSSDGVRLAFLDLSPTDRSREPILLIHGFASNHAVNWVNTLWLKTLTHAGRRVVALDNRGHGQSEKLYDPAGFHRAHGGGRAGAARPSRDRAGGRHGLFHGRADHRLPGPRPSRAGALHVLGGLGHHLVGGGLPMGIADAMEAPPSKA